MVKPLGCEILGTSQTPLYHGRGLLPANCNHWSTVLTPGLYAPKGEWTLRNLTVEEILVAKDCGHVALNLLGSGTLTNDFLRKLLPGGVWWQLPPVGSVTGEVTPFS